MIPSLKTLKGFIWHVEAQIVFCGILKAFEQTIVQRSVKIDALDPRRLTSVGQELQSHLSVSLIAAGFLALSRFLEVVADCPVAFSVQVVSLCAIEHGLIV